MRKFIIKISIFGIPSMLFILFANIVGDKSRIFDNEYEQKIVRILSKGKNATNISNYDDRKFQEIFINNLEFRPDIVVIGSSRSFSIDSSLFRGKSFVNLSVSRASIYDFIAIYQLLKLNNKLPKKLILSVDPWIFNEKNHHSRWLTLEKYYNQFTGKESGDEINWFIIRQAFSISYFQESLFEIKSRLKGLDEPIPTFEIYNESNTKLKDGSLVYKDEIRNASIAIVKRKAGNYILGNNYGLSDYSSHSNELLNHFISILRNANRNKVEVVLFLAPFNPFIYDDLISKFPMIIKTEKLLNDIAIQFNVKIMGSYDPSHHNLDFNDFYDGLHLRKKKIDSLFIKSYAIN